MSPYHTVEIPKGVIGELSKVYEEVEELRDADKQDNPVLILCEIADILGALEEYTQKKYNIPISDIKKMTDLNKKAFQNGFRN